MNPKVKKAFYILFILVCLAGLCFGVYTLVSNLNLKSEEEVPTQTEQETDGVLRVRLASLPDSDFELWAENGELILIHDEFEKTFDWSGTFTPEYIQMNDADYDGDGEKELAIVTSTVKDGVVTANELHILEVLQNGREYSYRDTWFSSNSFRWQSENAFHAEQTANQKRVMLTLNEESWYFRAPANEDGTYYAFESVTYGTCRFRLVEGTAEIQSTVEVQAIFTDYEETCMPGIIVSKLVYEGEQYVYQDAAFTPDEKWSAAPPADGEPFRIVVENKDPKVSTGLSVHTFDFVLEAGLESDLDFEENFGDERYLTAIRLTEQYIELVLPSSMEFNMSAITATPPLIWVGGDDGYYIQGDVTFFDEEDFYVMHVRFDEAIHEDDYGKLTFHCA